MTFSPFGSTRVLIIEDNPGIVRMLEMMLRRLGLSKVDQAVDGVVGLKMLVKGDYDVILLDHQLPGLRGVEVARVVRQTSGLRQPHIIMVTADTSDTDFQRALKTGGIFDDAIAKPFSYETLERKLRGYLERNPRAGAAAPDAAGPAAAREADGDLHPGEFLDYAISTDRYESRVSVRGLLTHRDAGTIKQIFSYFSRHRETACVLQIDDLVFADEFGIGSLVLMSGQLAERRKALHVVSPRGYVKGRLAALGVHRILRISESGPAPG